MASLQGADLCKAYLQGANLEGADLRWADLRKANLPGAFLGWAYLVGANLRNANLTGADLAFTCVMGFQLCRYFGFRHGDYVRIGCEGHDLDYWLKNYKELGKQNKYLKDEIELIGGFLRLISKYDC